MVILVTVAMEDMHTKSELSVDISSRVKSSERTDGRTEEVQCVTRLLIGGLQHKRAACMPRQMSTVQLPRLLVILDNTRTPSCRSKSKSETSISNLTLTVIPLLALPLLFSGKGHVSKCCAKFVPGKAAGYR